MSTFFQRVFRSDRIGRSDRSDRSDRRVLPVATPLAALPVELHTPAGVLLGDEADHPAHLIVGHEAIDRVVFPCQVLVGEALVNGPMTIPTERQGLFAATALGDQVMVRGVQVGTPA